MVGRKKDMVKVGAHRISTKEIEDALLAYPEVVEAAAIGVPDEILGEAIRAFVVLSENATAGKRGLEEFLRQRLAVYKLPKTLDVRAQLPKNESGKIMKEVLRAEAAAATATEPSAAAIEASAAPASSRTSSAVS